jgi:hypothetical protein
MINGGDKGEGTYDAVLASSTTKIVTLALAV